MEKNTWTITEVKRLFRMEERNKSVQAIYKSEEKGEIPRAERIARGKVKVRQWKLDQLPAIGEKYGFLEKPEKQVVICKYIQKGGVLKTTTSFNEAKTLALNGIKTLVIGLDFECSITDVILPHQEISDLEQSEPRLGLYHYFAESASLDEIICKTSLPTLDIIPETHDLVILDKWFNHQTRREDFFKEKLLSQLQNYDVVIFDNGPSWNHLIENSVACSTSIVTPLGCNLLAYNASRTNLSSIFDFQRLMKITGQKIIMIPTLLDRTSLSQQIYAQYISLFSKYIIPMPIKISVKAQEALMCKQTIFEYAPTSQIAQDYYDLIRAMWSKIGK